MNQTSSKPAIQDLSCRSVGKPHLKRFFLFLKAMHVQQISKFKNYGFTLYLFLDQTEEKSQEWLENTRNRNKRYMLWMYIHILTFCIAIFRLCVLLPAFLLIKPFIIPFTSVILRKGKKSLFVLTSIWRWGTTFN